MITVIMNPPLGGGLVDMVVPFPVTGKGARRRDIDQGFFPPLVQRLRYHFLRDSDLPYTTVQRV